MQLDHEPLIRVMALHALAYCERLFYLEEVEEIRVADERVYAGRTLHEELALEEGEEHSAFEIESSALGISGKLDAVRRRGGTWIPYEYKRGRARRAEDGSTEAWPSDAVQAAAYAMLLEEHTDEAVPEARVRYHADSVTVRVPVDDAARGVVRRAVERARELRSCLERPPVASNESLCIRCSLAPVCLPEEERLAIDSDWEPLRLFPPDDEGEVVHVTGPHSRVRCSGDSLVVELEDGEKRTFPANALRALVIHGHGQVTTQAIRLCAASGVSLHWLTAGGSYIGALSAGAGQVHRRIRQYAALSDPDFCLGLAKRLAHAKVEGQLRYVLRATREMASRPETVLRALNEMRQALAAMPRAEGIDSLRGHEGASGRAFFSTLPFLLTEGTPEVMRPTEGRSRRPPIDRFNALLSFGYALLYRSVHQAVLAVGLEPALGFYHTPRSAAQPLVLDLMELFRVPVWDVALIGSVNRRQWDPDASFVVTGKRVWLSDAGRRKAIELYERRLAETWKHPVMNYSLSYRRTIELEVRLLEKEWTGKPGLFARARLR
jgi:CRISPR-associated protein Cas1